MQEVRHLRQLLDTKAERPYCTVREFADRLKMSQRSVRTWLTQGLPHIHCGRSVRIPVRAADAWLEARGKESRRFDSSGDVAP